MARVRRKTSVGMDGLPFALFGFPVFCGRILHAMFWGLKLKAVPVKMMTEARLSFPPKKEGKMKEGRYICRVGQLRPLAVHIVPFRLIWLVIMASIKKYAGDMMQPGQDGMVGCASNVLWVDGGPGMAASQNSKAGALLIDFKGAFTSIRHSFLLRLMRCLGCPTWLLALMEVAYMGIYHVFVWDGKCCTTMIMEQGVTMGNPGAAFSFNVTLDSCLWALGLTLEAHEGWKDYMDDVVVLLMHARRVEAIMEVLELFRRLAGLTVNLRKTVWVPAVLSNLSVYAWTVTGK